MRVFYCLVQNATYRKNQIKSKQKIFDTFHTRFHDDADFDDPV